MRLRVLASLSLCAVMYTGVLNVRLVAAHLRSDHPQAVSQCISRYDCLHLGVFVRGLLFVFERARVCSFVFLLCFCSRICICAFVVVLLCGYGFFLSGFFRGWMVEW